MVVSIVHEWILNLGKEGRAATIILGKQFSQNENQIPIIVNTISGLFTNVTGDTDLIDFFKEINL